MINKDEIVKATLNITGESTSFQMPFITENVKLTQINDKLMSLEMVSDDSKQRVVISFEKK